MSQMLPKIVVITPVLNGGAFIETAIKSVLSQSYPNLGYIVRDGGSIDNTLTIIKKYQPYLTLVQAKDGGPGDVYNQEIKRTDATIICMLNSDDWLEPDILHLVGEEFAKDDSLDVVSTCTRLVRKNKSGRFDTIKSFGVDEINFNFSSIIEWPLTNSRFYRKRVFEKYGYFVTTDRYGKYNIPADTELLLDFARHPLKNKCVDRMGYTLLCHEGSLTMNSDYKKHNQISLQLIEIYEKFLREKNLTQTQKALVLKHHAKELIHVVFRSVRIGNIALFMQSYKAGLKTHKLHFLNHLMSYGLNLITKYVRRLNIAKSNQ